MPAPMLYRELPATPKLESVVACFWEFAASEATPLGHLHTIPVDGCASIGYVKPTPRVVFVGPRIQQLKVPISPGDRIWGVRFLPGATRAVIGKSGSAWRDKVGLLELEDPQLATEMKSALGNSSSLEEAIPCFDKLWAPGIPCAIARSGVLAITASRGDVRIRDLPKVAGVSERQFLRRFREEVGLTPKQFARICRFRATAMAALNAQGANW